MDAPTQSMLTLRRRAGRVCRAALVAGAWLCGAAAAQARELTVVQIAPFGGNLAVEGRDFNLGAMIALDEVNASGGAGGHRLRLLSGDDGYRPAETVQHFRNFTRAEAPIAVLGLWGTASAEALLTNPAFVDSGIPVVGVRSGDSSLRKYPQLFHVRASYREEVRRIVSHIQTVSIERIVVVYQEDSFGHDALAAARASGQQLGVKVLESIPHKPDSLDMRDAVARVMATQAQAVVLLLNTNATAALVKQLRAARSSMAVFTTSTVEASTLVAQLGAEQARGLVIAQSVPSPFRSSAPVVRNFRARMKALGIAQERANFASLEGYIAARVLAQAVRQAGNDPTPASVTRALERIRSFDLGGFRVGFGPHLREGSQFVEMSMIAVDGRLVQ